MSVAVVEAGSGDRAAVMSFIDAHWRRDHVLATSEALFEWQYGRDDGGYNVVIARDGDDLLGVLGFIDTGDLDPSQAGAGTVWLALWKVRDDAPAGLGLRLLRHLERSRSHAALGVVGIGDDRHPAMYRALGFHTGELAQHVLTSADAPLSLVHLPGDVPRPIGRAGGVSLRAVGGGEVDQVVASLRHDDVVPEKTAAYLRRRYVEHPFYRYDLHGVIEGGRPVALIVARVADAGGPRVLRIVDVIGDVHALAGAGAAIGAEIDATGAEHADLWEAGIPSDVLADAGFLRVDPDGPLVVPGHLEPVVRANVRLRYAIKTTRPHRILRGDGDQDRPNQIVAA